MGRARGDGESRSTPRRARQTTAPPSERRSTPPATAARFRLDTIASLGTMPFEMDGWGVDVAVTGSQEGLMTLPGLGFVAAGPKAMAAHKTSDLRPRHWACT